MIQYKAIKKQNRLKDLTGSRFGRLVVLACAGRQNNRTYYAVQCDCGITKTVRQQSLVSGATTSCGCRRDENIRDRRVAAGKRSVNGRKTTEVGIWKGIIARCENRNVHNFSNYGGRGIRVCEGIKQSFQLFLDIVGNRPSNQHSIDRKDVNGNYSCGSCRQCVSSMWDNNIRWATDKAQRRNKRNSAMVTYQGRTMCVADWADELGVPQYQIRNRLRLGWTTEKALSK